MYGDPSSLYPAFFIAATQLLICCSVAEFCTRKIGCAVPAAGRCTITNFPAGAGAIVVQAAGAARVPCGMWTVGVGMGVGVLTGVLVEQAARENSRALAMTAAAKVFLIVILVFRLG